MARREAGWLAHVYAAFGLGMFIAGLALGALLDLPTYPCTPLVMLVLAVTAVGLAERHLEGPTTGVRDGE